MTTTVADRFTNVDTAAGPNALLGIQGIGQSPREEITVVNNADASLTVTIETTNFTFEPPDSGTQTTFQLVPTDERTVTFSPENGQTDDVAFTGIIDDGSGESATIQFTRSITIPPSSGTTYRIRSVHSDLYLTGEYAGWGSAGNVTQEPWQDNPNQQWTLETDGAASTIGFYSGYVLLGLGDSGSGDVQNVVSELTFGGAGDDQRWNVVENADGTFRIENVQNGDVLDVESAATQPGANVITYPWKGNDVPVANQKWELEPV